MELLKLPFFTEIEHANTILLSGAGGGYDVFCTLPLYFGLISAGKTVHLANLSFSSIYASNGKKMGTALVKITSQSISGERYFPELHLSRWLAKQDYPDTIYCIDRTGAKPVAIAYQTLADHLRPDAVIVVDGGTDSLMRGDEASLGTPQEDIATIAAVDELMAPVKLLVCLGFGVDAFHGICHTHFLEAVSDIIRQGGYLGAWSLTNDMPEARLYDEAIEYVHQKMFNNPSIVSSSILSAIEGQFGDHHRTYRTRGSELFINPLMSLYWAFRLETVARRNLYLEQIKNTETFQELSLVIEEFRETQPVRPWQALPM